MRIDYYEDPYTKDLHNISRLFFVRVSRLYEEIDGVEVYKAISLGYTKEEQSFSGTAAIIQFDMTEGLPTGDQFDFDIEQPTQPLDPDGIYISINGYRPEKIAVYDTYQRAYINSSVVLSDKIANTLLAVRPNPSPSFYELGWLVINHFDEYHSQSAKLGYPNNNSPWAIASNNPMEQIKQYVGETTPVFTKGHFYQRVPTTEHWAGAKWVEIDIGGGGGGGTQITDIYWIDGTTIGPQPVIEANENIEGAPIPAASDTKSGVITTGTQNFAGDKTFEGNTQLNGSILLGPNNYVTSLPASGIEGQVIFLIED